MPSSEKPHIKQTMTAVERLKRRSGTIKVDAKTNLDRKVKIVDSHISFALCLFSDSSEMWMPRASEKASAMAIVNMPLRTAILEWVPECSPTISPKVVIIPEVEPKLKPTLSECLMALS